MKKNSTLILTAYILAHITMFAAWANILYMGVFAEKTNLYSVLLVAIGTALFVLHCTIIVHDAEQVLEIN